MNTNKKIKLIGTIIGVLLFILLITGITYAWVMWQSDNTIVSGKTGCFPDVNYSNGTSLSTDNLLLFDEKMILKNNNILLEEGMSFIDVTANVSSDCETLVALNIDVDVTNLSEGFITGDSVGAFKYVLASYNPSSISEVSELKGNYLEIITRGDITNTGVTRVVGDELTTDIKGYLLIFYVDGSMAFNDVQNSEFSVNIIGKVVQMG